MAPIQVQKQSGTSTTTSVVATFSPAATAGNTLIAVAYAGQPGTANIALSGWTAGPSDLFNSSHNQIAMFYKVAAGGETTVTATEGAATTMQLHIFEYSGMSATPFDVSANAGVNDGNGVTSRVTGTTDATAQNDEVAIVAVGHGGATSALTWSNLFNVETTTSRLDTGSRILTATGTYTSTASWTTSRVSGGLIGVFKAATGPSSVQVSVTVTDPAGHATSQVVSVATSP